MNFAKGYEDGFTGKPAQQDEAEYMRGHALGVKQAARQRVGDNGACLARVK